GYEGVGAAEGGAAAGGADPAAMVGRVAIDVTAAANDHAAGPHVDAAAEPVGGLVVTHGATAIECDGAAGGVDSAAARVRPVRDARDVIRDYIDRGQRQVRGAINEHAAPVAPAHPAPL